VPGLGRRFDDTVADQAPDGLSDRSADLGLLEPWSRAAMTHCSGRAWPSGKQDQGCPSGSIRARYHLPSADRQHSKMIFEIRLCAGASASARRERAVSVHADGQWRCIRPEAPDVGPLMRQRPVEDAQVSREYDAASATRAFRPEPEIVVGRTVCQHRDMVRNTPEEGLRYARSSRSPSR
jgi:hypothetical protein